MLKQMLKAELDYSRFIKMNIGPILGLIAYKLLVSSSTLNVFAAVIILLIVMFFYVTWIKEKRQRFLTLLPVTPAQIAWLRISRTIFPIVLLFLVYLFTILPVQASNGWDNSYSEFVLLTGFTISATAFYFTFYDWMAAETDTFNRYFAGTLAYMSSIILIIAISSCAVSLYESSLYLGSGFVLFILAFSTILLFSTVKTFIRRKSYLN